MSLPKQPHKATPSDHEAMSPAGGRHGGVGDRHRHGETATVISYQSDTYTATVRTNKGRILKGLPRLRSSPGDIAPLEQGTEVLINYDYGAPFILGVLASPAGRPTDVSKHSVTDVEGFGGQGLNKSDELTGGNYRLGSEPDDVMPGDWAQVGTDGNLLGVLAGGVNVIKSGALSQIRTHLINDLVEIISRNYRHITDMGEFTVQNNNGRINLRFRGASDQKTEAGPDEENWTIKFDLGSEGDLFNLELCTPKGQTLFRMHVDSDGKCELYGLNGVSINSGSQNGTTSSEETTGNKIRTVGGNHTVAIEGSDTCTVKNSVNTTVYNDLNTSAGNDVRTQALRDHAISAGRNMYVSVQGSLLGDAMVYDIVSGDWVVNIGSAISPNPLSGFKMSTFSGDMQFESTAGGNYSISSLLGELKSTTRKATISTNMLPDSVVLGGGILASHLVKFEQLQAHLATLYSLLDTHIHVENGTAVAAGIPVFGVSGPPVIPFTPILSPSVLTFKSITSGVSL